jgi:hypothetical protein
MSFSENTALSVELRVVLEASSYSGKDGRITVSVGRGVSKGMVGVEVGATSAVAVAGSSVGEGTGVSVESGMLVATGVSVATGVCVAGL